MWEVSEFQIQQFHLQEKVSKYIINESLVLEILPNEVFGPLLAVLSWTLTFNMLTTACRIQDGSVWGSFAISLSIARPDLSLNLRGHLLVRKLASFLTVALFGNGLRSLNKSIEQQKKKFLSDQSFYFPPV